MDAPRFVFLGTPAFAATILDRLVEEGWKPALVITEQDKPAGRGLETRASAVSRVASELSLPVAKPATMVELLNSLHQLHSLNPLDLLVVAAYGKILPAELLDLPRLGAINVHASLLPKHRGASPIQATILQGDTETGISFMEMEPTLDTGAVLNVVRVPITPTETSSSLTETLAKAAADSIVDVLTRYVAGEISPQPQDDAEASYASRLAKEDGQVDLATIDSMHLDRMVRAFNPWPGVYTDEFGERLILRAGHLDGSTYVVTTLQWAGKRPVDGATFARAYPHILTMPPKTIRLGPEFS